MYPHQANVFLGLEGDLVSLLAHVYVVLNEISLVDGLLHYEAHDNGEYGQGEEHARVAPFVLDQRLCYYAVYRHPKASRTCA